MNLTLKRQKTVMSALEDWDYLLLNGDCLDMLRAVPASSIGLAYADPPWFSRRTFRIGSKFAFNDKWAGGLSEYLSWITPRLNEIRRVLKPSGSVYLHCDPHASHYLKVIMDRIFGYDNFINEIVWKRQSAHSDGKQGARHFGRIHDTILLYAKTSKYYWSPQYMPYEEGYLRRHYNHLEKETGRRYALGDLYGPGGASKGNPKYEFMGIKRYWRYSEGKMHSLLERGLIVMPKNGKVPTVKRYLDEMKGLPIQDVWAETDLGQKERLVYPTQKPVKLMERLIRSSAAPGSIFLEAFCGSASASVVASTLGHKCVCIDTSRDALEIAKYRLEKVAPGKAVIVSPTRNAARGKSRAATP